MPSGNSASEWQSGDTMRTIEIVVGLIVALVLFVVLKLIGIVIKFAAIAAVIGFILGLAVTRMVGARSS